MKLANYRITLLCLLCLFALFVKADGPEYALLLNDTKGEFVLSKYLFLYECKGDTEDLE